MATVFRQRLGGMAVRGGGLLIRVRTAALAATLLGGLLLSGCATNSYAGISFASGAADVGLQALARRAKAGDKHAQLELGIRYEEGRGVPIDLGRAKTLYREAATDSGGTELVYVPASVKRGRAASVPINRGPRIVGLPEAQAKLQGLLGNQIELIGSDWSGGMIEPEKYITLEVNDTRNNEHEIEICGDFSVWLRSRNYLLIDCSLKEIGSLGNSHELTVLVFGAEILPGLWPGDPGQTLFSSQSIKKGKQRLGVVTVPSPRTGQSVFVVITVAR